LHPAHHAKMNRLAHHPNVVPAITPLRDYYNRVLCLHAYS
jgi:hypothetical protein